MCVIPLLNNCRIYLFIPTMNDNTISRVTCAECGHLDVSSYAKQCPNPACGLDPIPGNCSKCDILAPKSKLKDDICESCRAKDAARNDAILHHLNSLESKRETGKCECCGNLIESKFRHNAENLNQRCYDAAEADLLTSHFKEKFDKASKWVLPCPNCGHPAGWFRCPVCGGIHFGQPTKISWTCYSAEWKGRIEGYYKGYSTTAWLECCSDCEQKSRDIAAAHKKQSYNLAKSKDHLGGCFMILALSFGLMLAMLLSLPTFT